METRYKYISSPDYINNLAFDYLETYTFQRGKDYEDKLNSLKFEYDKLKVRKESDNSISSNEVRRFKELNELFGFTQYLIGSDGKFHFSCIKINTFKAGDQKVEILKKILRTDVTDIPMFLCAPTYRDAIVFYDSAGKIISSLNVCLSCLYMETKMFNHINADYQTYDLLKKWFINIGHNVGDS